MADILKRICNASLLCICSLCDFDAAVTHQMRPLFNMLVPSLTLACLLLAMVSIKIPVSWLVSLDFLFHI